MNTIIRQFQTLIWIPRVLIIAVFSINMLCAILFMVQPASFINQFDLRGETGIVVISSIGLLFTMWNVPYAIAIIDPAKYRISLLEAIIMQAIGFLGEAYLYLNIVSLENTKNSIFRFMVFDFAGLILLLIALFMVIRWKKNG